jgi:uncharacterized repeat protein (TIGR01451 family)/LPXTG-motif cell wall-anchored protein
MRNLLQSRKYRISLLLVFLLIFQLIIPTTSKVFAGETNQEAAAKDGFTEEDVSQGKQPEEEVIHEGLSPEEASPGEPQKNLPEQKDLSKQKESQLAPQEQLPQKQSPEEQSPKADPEPEKSVPVSMTAEKSRDSEDTKGKDLGNIFTLDLFRLGGRNGTDIHNGDVIDIADGTEVYIEFDWNTEGLDAKAGDWAEMELPGIFTKVDIKGQPIKILDEDGNELEVGTYSILDGVLKFVFNENIERDDVVNGTAGFGLKFNLEKFKDNIEQAIVFHDSKDKTLTIIAKPQGKQDSISKEGHPDHKHDAREITWAIDVVNTSDGEITDATVKDVIPDGLKLKEDSFKINELILGYEGKKSLGDEVSVTPDIAGKEFTVGFDSLAPYKGYRIEYTTTIEDYSKDTFTNDAIFSYGETKLPAKATVDGLTRSNAIEKDGWPQGDGTIWWKIDVNKAGGKLDHAVVEDPLPEGLELKAGSMVVKKFKNDKPMEHEWDEPLEFPLDLGKIEADERYEIEFLTTVDYEKINGGEYQKDNKFTNQTVLKDGDKPRGEAEKEVTVQRPDILSKVGNSHVDYENKTITWTVKINEARHPLDQVTLTDLLPKGLSLSEDDIKVTSLEGKDYTPNITIQTVTDGENAGKTELDMVFDEVGTDQITVEYTTPVEDFTMDKFNNVASLGGDGVGEGEHEISRPVNPEKNTYEKSFQSIDYNKKTMKWQIVVDPKREALEELTIVDTFPNKGLILLPDTLQVQVGGKEISKSEGYTLTPNEADGTEGYQKGFTMVFDAPILPLNSRMVITYETSYDPQLKVDDFTPDLHTDGEAKVYRNSARFTGKTINGNGVDVTRDAQTTVREDSWNSGKKEGRFVHFDGEGNQKAGWASGRERKIAWQLYTNYQQQNLGTGVVVKDTLSYEGTIDEDSITVKVYDVDQYGNTKITGKVLEPENYKLAVDGKTFTLTFQDDFEVKDRYVIEFLTAVPDISEKQYPNQATVQVGEKEYPYSATLHYENADKFLDKKAADVSGNQVYTGDGINWEVQVNESLSVIKEAEIVDTISKGLTYVEGSLEVHKLMDGEKVPLTEGEDYTLGLEETEEGKTVLTLNFKEDVDTVLVLGYQTVVTGTDGQVNNKVEFEGTGIEKKTVESERLDAKQYSHVSGEMNPKKGVLQVTKVDAEAKSVIVHNEAEFTLWYKLNGEYKQFGDEPFKTENGVLKIGNLPLRTYYLREAKAPNGYVLSDKQTEVPVDKGYQNKEENIAKVDFVNVREKTEITGTKVWEGGEASRPESIELQLFRDGKAYGDPVALDGTEEKPWEHTWTDLDKTDIGGKPYQYTADEVRVPENYKKEVSEDGLTVTNTYVSPRTQVTGTKVWIDGPEEKSDIELQLYRNGKAYGDPVTLDGTEEKPWTHTWADLEERDRRGEPYSYTVDEINVPESYGKAVSEDGLTVTNTYASSKQDVVGRKVWVDGEYNRPDSIQLQLYRESDTVKKEKVGSPVTLEKGTYEYNWRSQDKTDRNGNEYRYTVEEIQVPENYGKSEDGLTVTNTYVSPKTQVTGTKVWNGGPEEKPAIWLKLYREVEGGAIEEVPEAEVKELADGTTEVEWTDLNETDTSGKKYKFSVKEVNKDGKDFVPQNYGKSEDGLTVTNTYQPPRSPENPKGPEDPKAPGKDETGKTPKKPEENKTGFLPKTGDNSPIGYYLAAILLVLVVLIVIHKRSGHPAEQGKQ